MIKIIQSKDKKGFWINGKYVLTENWHISKNKFTEAEQQQFEQHLNYKPMLQSEINIQKQLIAQYEAVRNKIGVAFHTALLNKLINSISVIQPEIVGC